MNIFCFLCHRNCLNHEDLKAHIKDDHSAQQNVDILILLQQLTYSEKLALKEELEERSSKANQYDSKELVQNNLARCTTPSNVSTKIMFWTEVENNPKHHVK